MPREYLLWGQSYVKEKFLSECDTAKLSNSEKENRNYDRKLSNEAKSKTMSELIWDLVLDFALYFVTVRRKYPLLVNSAQGTTKSNYTSLDIYETQTTFAILWEV